VIRVPGEPADVVDALAPDQSSGSTGSPHVGHSIWSEVWPGGTVPRVPQESHTKRAIERS
jgi:hypothetical protein